MGKRELRQQSIEQRYAADAAREADRRAFMERGLTYDADVQAARRAYIRSKESTTAGDVYARAKADAFRVLMGNHWTATN